ncbi:MAG: acyltransferase family protein [Planctomycetota bacterium]
MGEADPPQVREFRVTLPIDRPGSAAPISRDPLQPDSPNEEPLQERSTGPLPDKTNPGGADDSWSKVDADPTAVRLLSLDAYRGFIMVAMASAGLGFTQLANNEKVVDQFGDSILGKVWRLLIQSLGYQFEHVAWVGCSFWDLIQPSFMFMVGVAMPFSNSRRQSLGHAPRWRWLHVLWRSLALVMLGIFLSSTGAPLTNFTFVNVLTQIGLGYFFLFYLSDRCRVQQKLGVLLARQGVVASVILILYWSYFAVFSNTNLEAEIVQTVVVQQAGEKEFTRANTFRGFAKRWNKHTNAAAHFDRQFLNLFPRSGDEIGGRKFWFNAGGYQTTNFIPSLATMILGLMAGTVLCNTDLAPWEKLRFLVWGGAICFTLVLPFDTMIWPSQVPRLFGGYTICPTIKRIWTPTWTLFSGGWTFFILSAFYWVIDIRGYRKWSWPLAIVGMNSIAMYVMSQLSRPFVKSALKTHFTTIDTLLGWEQGFVYTLLGDQGAYAPFFERCLILFILWLVCYWMYRRKLFIRI